MKLSDLNKSHYEDGRTFQNVRKMYFKHELMDMYEDMLNDQEPVTICGITYDQGRAYRILDEISFECDVNQWEEGEFDQINFEDFTQEEIERYMLSSNQHMYLRKKGF